MVRLCGLLLVTACGRLGFDELPLQEAPLPEGVQRIASGRSFTCALRSDASLWCWGSSFDGELGTGSDGAQPRPVQVPTFSPSPLVDIGTGDRLACALDKAGDVWCWGSNSREQRAVAAGSETREPTKISGLPRPAVSLAVGATAVCVVLDDATAWCWGDNDANQLGLDRLAVQSSPVPREVLDDVAQLVIGDFHVCALRGDTSVACWGMDYAGALGDGGGSHFEPSSVPDLRASRLASGTQHVCAVVAGGKFRCWGDNSNGQLGDPSLMSGTNTPAAISSLGGFVDLTAGIDHTCGLTDDGLVHCWGDNDFGELGNGTAFDTPNPQLVTTGSIVRLSSGGHHTCAIRSDDSVACWGSGGHGELGDGKLSVFSPQQVTLPGPATAIAAGFDSACAVVGGVPHCWGNNSSGQLAQPFQDIYWFPSPIALDLTGIQSLSIGRGHTCAIRGGEMTCWGANNAGQLGRGTTTSSEGPGAVDTIVNPVAMATGFNMSCAIANLETQFCWGTNDYGQLGTTGPGKTTPQSAATGNFSAVAVGLVHACAVSAGQQLACWGHNSTGQVGNGQQGQEVAPFAFVDGNGSLYTAVGAGDEHTCALTAGGAVECFGRNTSGELGTPDSHLAPAPIDFGATTANAISINGRNGCALTGNGVACWGSNTSGQLGLGHDLSKRGPQFLGRDPTQIAVGHDFACMLENTAGTVSCWGANHYGQVGNGTFTIALEPVAAQFP